MKRSPFAIVSSLIFFFCVSLIGTAVIFLFSSAVDEEAGKQYFLRPGTSTKTLVADLFQQGIIKYPTLFSIYTHLQPHQILKTGEYYFPKGSTPFSIWRQVTQGTGLVYHAFTIVPGWSFKQLLHELGQTTDLRHITTKLDDKKIMEQLGYANISPEGQFFPETYYYTRGVPDLVILKRAIDLMQNRLNEVWKNRVPDLPYKNTYEALIAASIIEKEAYLDNERPLIAGVLVNRLKRDMLLQFDPTVIYGLGQRYHGKIHKDNLLENNAYNTYVHKGLPPTPIAMPSMTSIVAALHPLETNYLYFVAKGDGSHQFSKTLLEHHVAVAGSSMRHSEWYFNEALIKRYLHVQLAERLINFSPNNN